MAKLKKLMLLVVGVFALVMPIVLAGCANEPETYSVAFYVQDANNTWQQEGQTLTVTSNGTVELPANPTKEFNEFRGWYDNEAFTGEKFTATTAVTKDLKLYACFVSKTVEMFINGVSQGEQSLEDVVNGNYNPGKNLTFDGWYTDETCGTKWDKKADTETLYAQSVAKVTFNDGYKDIYTVDVKPFAEKLIDPSKEIIEDETENNGKTVQEAKIVQSYMDKNWIKYVDENGNAIDFTKDITENMTITVLWNSPGLTYTKNPKTNAYHCDQLSNIPGNVPVVSIQGEAVIDGNTVKVEGITQGDMSSVDLGSLSACKKIIIGEGIKSISGMSDLYSMCTAEEVVLPNSLVILNNSFNGLANLKKVTMPSVKILVNSFFKNALNHMEALDCEILVPDNAINLSQVPANLKFSENSLFYKDETGKRIYKKDGANKDQKLLIVDYNVTADKKVVIEEGVQGVQVGAFCGVLDIQHIVFPSTFKYVGYNEKLTADYNFYVFKNTASGTDNILWSDEYVNDPKGKVTTSAFSITNNMSDTDCYGSFHPIVGIEFNLTKEAVDAFVKDYNFIGCTDDMELMTNLYGITGDPALWEGMSAYAAKVSYKKAA